MSDEHWSEWKSHTPGPCPVPVGTVIQVRVKFPDGMFEGVPFVLCVQRQREPSWSVPHPGWTIGFETFGQIREYRIRQYPQASKLIQSITTNIPEPVE